MEMILEHLLQGGYWSGSDLAAKNPVINLCPAGRVLARSSAMGNARAAILAHCRLVFAGCADICVIFIG